MMFLSNITNPDLNEILAKGIPALSPAAGLTNLSTTLSNLDMNSKAEDNRPNGWGRNGDPYLTRWLHSDLKNMAYFYTYKLFNQLVSQGDLQ